MNKILLTGSTGFIGSRLEQFLRKKYTIISHSSSDGDIADPTTLDRIDSADHVIHLAARTFVPDSWQEPEDFIRCNVVGTTNVLEYCKENSATLTYVSAYIYGQPESIPVSEEAEIRPNNPYALSKYQAEEVCRFYSKYHDVRVAVIRPFNIYGPNQADHFLIPTIIRQIVDKDVIKLKDLEPKRDFLYIDDLIDLLWKSIHRVETNFEIFNAGSGISYSVKEVVEIIQDVAGTELPIISEGDRRQAEISNVCADISKANKILDWKPSVDFREGIKRILQ